MSKLSGLWTLIRLQLINLYGINVYRNLKDPKEKKKKFWLGVAYGAVVVVFAFYIGALSFGYVYMGLGDILPAYLIMIFSLVILMFSVFKAGSVIYQRNMYDILASLPIRHSDLVISRFVCLYVENVLLTLGLMVPAFAVYGVLVRPAISFYVIGWIVILFIPFIPITISVFVGSLITAVSARSKHKNVVSIVLSMALVIGVMIGSFSLTGLEEVSIEEIQNMLGVVLELIETVYPPAVWLGSAMIRGDYLLCLGCVLGGTILLAFVIWLVSATYKTVSMNLYATYAKHEYKMEELKKTSLLKALYLKEVKRYFASSVYVTNTIVSPVMGILAAVGFLFLKPEQLTGTLGDLNLPAGMMLNVNALFPMALATIFCMMPITAVSVSMEGKEWWIVKTLPIRTKDLLCSKLLMNFTVIGPFCILAALIVGIGQKVSPLEMLWLILVPATAMLFSGVFGQTVNLKLAVFDWENEVTIVKQSASAFVGGILPFFVMMVFTMGSLVVPEPLMHWVMLGFCLIVNAITAFLYKKNMKVNLLTL